jgi:Peptidase family M23
MMRGIIMAQSSLAFTGRLLTGVAVLAVAAPALAELPAPEIVSPLVATPITSPNPMLGADARRHLVYEIVLMDIGGSAIAVRKIEVLDANGDALIATLQGEALAKILRFTGPGKGTALSAGGSGVLFMDVTLAEDAMVPRALKHRFQVAVSKPEGKPSNSNDRDPAPPQTQSFIGAPLDVGKPAVVIVPMLKGPRWVVAGGCCDTITYHRGATLPINGAIRVAERYAIDFVQLDNKNKIASGPTDKLSSYAFFGREIYSVADGTVVAMADDRPEQVPGKLPEGISLEMALGNYVVVDIGEGRFAFYAHMQPGSLRVKPGDKVTAGQVLGLLGNSGNTDAPHLHFHVMDGASPLLSNGLPYVFTSFTGEGRVTDEQPLFSGGAAPIDPNALSGPHKNQLPLNLQVIGFPN